MPEARRRRSWVWIVGIATLAVGGLLFYGDVDELKVHLSRFDGTMLAAALALATGNYAVRFLRWQYYLRLLRVEVRWLSSCLIFLCGFVMTITPGKLGEVFKSVLLAEHNGTPVAATAPIVIAERVTDLAALVLLTTASCAAFDGGLLIAATGAVITGLALAVCAIRPLGNAALVLAARLPLVKRWAPRLAEAYEALYAMTRPAPLVVGTLLGVGAWVLEAIALHVILIGFGAQTVSLLESTFVYSASTIAGAVAMMPGGLGVTEAGIAGLLRAIHPEDIPKAVAGGATLLVRLATLWWAVLLGGVALMLYRHRRLRAK